MIEAGGHNDNNRLPESTADLVVASYINNNLNENHIVATQALLLLFFCALWCVCGVTFSHLVALFAFVGSRYIIVCVR